MRKQKRFLSLYLPACFELLDRDLFAITPDENDAEILWHIRERIRNGNHIRYQLEAKGRYLSENFLNFTGAKGFLTAAVSFHPHTGKSKVFLQDFWVIPQGKGMGTLLLDLFIKFLQEWNSFFEVESVQGELSPVDEEDEENRKRRDHLYKKAGFSIFLCENTGKRFIKAQVKDLKRLPHGKTQLLSPSEVFQLVKEGLRLKKEAFEEAKGKIG